MDFDEFFDKVRNPTVFRNSAAHVTVLVTTKCPIGCNHCLEDSRAESGEDIDVDSVLSWMLQSIENTPVRAVSLTGGEPFYRYSLLLKLCDTYARAGMSTDILTSGYWATTAKTARSKVTVLARAGLRGLSLSVDEYHLEKLPAENVRLSIKAAKEAGLLVTVSYRSCNTLDLWVAYSFLENTLSETFPLVDAFIMGFIQPIGRARNLPSIAAQSHKQEPLRMCPAFGLTLYPPDRVYACCGHLQPISSPLFIGRAGDDSFANTYRNWRCSLLSLIVEVAGVTSLLRLARKQGLDSDLPPSFPNDDICGLCTRLFASPERADFYLAHYGRYETRRELAFKKFITIGDPWPLLHLEETK